MGAYLSSPVTDKKSDDFVCSEKYACGLSGMQGWRISMEDAYNCVPQIDNDTGFFAVYDGHGGGEVAMYCSHHFIDLLKETEEYKEGRIMDALKRTFMEIDKNLRDSYVVKELKLLSQMEPGDPPVTDEDIRKLEEQEKQEKEEVEDETKLLYEEATMSIEDLLAKYGRVVNETEQKLKSVKEKSVLAESSKAVDGSDTEAVDTDKSEDLQDELKEKKQSKAIGDNEKEAPVEQTENKEDSKNHEAGDEGPVLKKKLQKEFLKVKPPKADDDDDSDDDALRSYIITDQGLNPETVVVRTKTYDYEGFESDEAVEGSSSEDEEDEEEDDNVDVEEQEEEVDEDENTAEQWVDEEDPMSNEAGVRAGVEEPGVDSGSTAVVAVLRDTDLYVANAGDSRCVLSRMGGLACDMSEDHKPEDEKELARITKAGGHVNAQGRVNGGLNLSRALGDHLYKTNSELSLENQMITALPDVRHLTLAPGDEFLVIACDGIWNVLSSQEVVDFVRSRLYPDCPNSTDNGIEQNDIKQETKISSICEELFQKCLAPDTTGDGTGCDNMTCIIVKFNQEWLSRRHLARKEGEIQNVTDNKEKKDIDNTVNTDVNSMKELTKSKVIESKKDVVESNKRSLVSSDETQCWLNGNSDTVKRAKVE